MGIWNTVQKWQGKSVPPCSMIVAAAGSSCRMGGQDKLFAPLAGVPVLTRTLRAIDRAELVSEIVVAAQEERMEAVADLCAAAALHKKVKVVKGGASRTESVLAAALECDPRAELIAIHDGARPLVRPEMIDEMIRAGWQTQAAAPSTPVTDTVKVADDDRWVASTPDRSTLYAVQTPQVFQANILKAAEAGAAIADTAHAPLAFGNSHPAVEMIVAALKESRYDTDLDLDLLFEISEYWEEMRKRGHYKRGVSSLTHMKVYSHQVPGGMMSNLVSQLEIQNAGDRLPEVMQEIPKVRAEVGYPPLVTPLSQIVGTQAVFNVLTGKRWSVVSKEMKDYI